MTTPTADNEWLLLLLNEIWRDEGAWDDSAIWYDDGQEWEDVATGLETE